jgi:hypothetical protein
MYCSIIRKEGNIIKNIKSKERRDNKTHLFMYTNVEQVWNTDETKACSFHVAHF